MTATTQSKLGAYSTHQQSNQDSRDTDARALLSCASWLNDAIETGRQDMKNYSDAIRHNQKLWTMFQVALSDANNPLPQPVKVTLLNLSRYVDRVSFRAVTEFQPQLLKSLIDINRAIASGLSVKAKAEAEVPKGAVEASPAHSTATAVLTSA